ncbi:2-isopropylmalate synthase [Suillus placidus]|uniref:2-isopropylmalate synthase n=1 Tax=Suillus placidus TaxID=48579 RepID=A0A9P7CYB8_9AGAM|nr:2-isopropylmalate synthase [Suillus placidus]
MFSPLKTFIKAPIWLSTDLRDGNQALSCPMTADQKLTFFRLLVKCGFKEIEIAYPSASDTNFAFEQTVELASRHSKLISDLADQYSASHGMKFRYEYSPETFTQTEMEFSLQGKAGPGIDRIIFNLPATVEIAPPNHYADQIEYFATHISERENIIISLHPHNDRGTAIAAMELIVLGGADRVEGCLFGNGERTGNVDLVTLALNLYTQGITPNLDFSDIQKVIDIVTSCNDLPVHPRHPYAGELVFTAFSRLHQDTIKKGFEAQDICHKKNAENGELKMWNIPYMPLDPADLRCSYEAVIRVNAQSGKGGITYLVKQHLQLDLPCNMQVTFYKVIQQISDREARKVTIKDITTVFRKTYHFSRSKYEGRLALKSFCVTAEPSLDSTDDGEPFDERRHFDGTMLVDGVMRVIRGDGNGPISALLNALRTHLEIDMTLRKYMEHAVGEGEASKAASYIELVATTDDVKETRQASESWWGVGLDSDIAASSLHAVLSAVNAAIGDRVLPELQLNVGFNATSGQLDVSDAIVNTLGLMLPRRLQTSFFEVVQCTVHELDGKISYDDLTHLFRETYGYEVENKGRFSLGDFHFECIEGGGPRFKGDMEINGVVRKVDGEGNGPLSAALAVLHSQTEGTLTFQEYSEHSVGEGSEVKAVSFMELLYELPGRVKKEAAWGLGSDTDITVSGIKAALRAASRLDVVAKKA